MEVELVNHFKNTNMRVMLATLFNRLPHIHYDIEVLMPIRGSVCMETTSAKYIIKKDEIFLLSQDEIHSGSQTGEPNLFAVLEVSPNFCKSYFPQLANVHILENHVTRLSNPNLYSCLRRTIHQMVICCSVPKVGSELKINSELCNFVLGILHYSRYKEYTESEMSALLHDNIRISRIIEYIKENYMHNISLASLAKDENINPSYLSRFISEQLGITFREYVNRLRAEKAAELLANTNLSKLEICVATGFSDYRYLNQEIQKVFRCSPEDLRNGKSNSLIISSGRKSDITPQHKIMDISEASNTLLQYFKNEN